MGTPNPFLFGGQPPVDNPFMDSGTGEVNPFLAQNQPVQPAGYGYNQFGQMQVDPNNPYGAQLVMDTTNLVKCRLIQTTHMGLTTVWATMLPHNLI